MSNRKKKRRKKLANEWAEFQRRHKLADCDLKLIRATGYLMSRVEGMLDEEEFAKFATTSEKVREIHQHWEQKIEQRRAAVATGEVEPKNKKKKKKKPLRHDPQWAKAKQVCRLNMEDIRMAKELGFSPKTLMSNVPSPNQDWKLPVKSWIRELYEKRQRKNAKGTD